VLPKLRTYFGEEQMMWFIGAVLILLLIWGMADIMQRKHAIIHNFPIIGHFRYWLEAVGPELRQYIVTSNNEERPFSRDERRWVYASSKKENNYFGFGTDNDLENSPNYLIIKHAAFPLAEPRPGDADFDPNYLIPCAKVWGRARGRAKAFRPRSVVYISGMSYGSLSAPAVEALNRGALLANCLHNTGEGGVAPHHKKGGELIWQIGTGYFGCRDAEGGFDEKRFVDTVQSAPIRAVEVKLSQGAKPGRGGVLPAAKITAEISQIRGIPLGRDCLSPASHSAFHDVDSLLDFVERLADLSGLPVGIKSAVGEQQFWNELARQMSSTNRGVDFIHVDGGEGGTGAAPLVFADHVALPFKLGMARVYGSLYQAGLHEQVVFVGAGKLGFPHHALMAFALGCDMVAIGREAMLAIGCIQAQRCQTGHCPTGVATQNRWLMSGLDPQSKSARLANYVVTLRKEILELCRACGTAHPGLITSNHFEVLDECYGARQMANAFAYNEEMGLPSRQDRDEILAIMDGPLTSD
jgi:glutamate synthase (ferredoxin)